MTTSNCLDEENEEVKNVDLHKERQFIEDAINKRMMKGESWYLIDDHWYKLWKMYVSSPDDASLTNHPGPIDNSGIMDQATSKLKERLLEGDHYQLIDEPGWSYLVDRYGLIPNQQEICRKVVEHGLFMTQTKVEVYLIELKLCRFVDIDNIVVHNFSETATIMDVVTQMKSMFEIADALETRIWCRIMPKIYEVITKVENTLQDNGISNGQMLVLEERNEKGEWPRQTRSRSLSGSAVNLNGSALEQTVGSSSGFSTSTISSYTPFSSGKMGRQKSMSMIPGLCGLSNIGNTCFMNSALQCLSNTTPLTKYFLTDTYQHELNPTNPLGMHGKIAEAYYELIHHIWGGQLTYFTPRHFKMQVGRFAPQFSGYQQQDSHELLAFLLDGLHEDLNRVKQKPYIELHDDLGRPDEVCATEAWRNHSLRNSSIIVDLFHGLFKSTVECPVCQKKSRTFDPFCYLSLPLPIKKERNIQVTFVSLDSSKKPIKLKVVVPKVGVVSNVTTAVAQICGTDPMKLVMIDVFNAKFHKRFQSFESLSQITDHDNIFVYEIPVNVENAESEELLILPVYLREIRQMSSVYNHSYPYSNSYLFGTPMLVAVPRECTTTTDLYQIILRSMRRFVEVPSNDTLTEEDLSGWNKDQNGDEEESMSEDDEQKLKIDALEQEKEQCQSDKPPVTLFQISIVNSAGTQDISQLQMDDPQPLKLTPRTHLAIDWNSKAKSKCYNEALATEVEEHPTLRASGPKKKAIALRDCLDLFLQREKLGEEDLWYCPQCKEHRQAYKKFDLWTLPKVLVIHLKRFSYNRVWRDKLDVLVQFPLKQLDLTEFVINKSHPRAVYDLHAVSNHFGGLGGGHYTAYAVNSYDGQWYNFDDTTVTSANADSAVSSHAYLLFYTRRGDPDTEIMNTSELLTEDAVFVDETMEAL